MSTPHPSESHPPPADARLSTTDSTSGARQHTDCDQVVETRPERYVRRGVLITARVLLLLLSAACVCMLIQGESPVDVLSILAGGWVAIWGVCGSAWVVLSIALLPKYGQPTAGMRRILEIASVLDLRSARALARLIILLALGTAAFAVCYPWP